MSNVVLSPDERIDDLGCKGYKIIQNKKRFCFGMDAVLLSHFAKINENDCVLDIGCGNGIIPILLAAKTKAKNIYGLEIQKDVYEIALKSVQMNSLQEIIKLQNDDINNAKEIYSAEMFNVVVTNPPYINNGNGIKNTNESKAIARHEIFCTLSDVVQNASYLLKHLGRFYMVHKPSRLPEIIVCLKENLLEPKTIQFVHSYVDSEPKMILIEAIKMAKPMLKVLPPLIIYNSDGTYTELINEIYKDKD